MIKHIVLLKTKENAPLQEIKKKIENLKNEIKEIISIEAGIDINFDPASSNLAIITILKNEKDLEIYAKHPKHIEVIKFIKPYILERNVVDFEKKG